MREHAEVRDAAALRTCFREPISEIRMAADYLNDAVSAHIAGDGQLARDKINLANMPPIRAWTESLWGKSSPYLQKRHVEGASPTLKRKERERFRMTSADKQFLHERDGYHCRFCGVRVIRREVRDRFRKLYPDLTRGNTTKEQHAAVQAMWAQYDHILPRGRGGDNDLDNIIVTCAPL
jgi:hypothetical protein